jgi:hypothetical protein
MEVGWVYLMKEIHTIYYIVTIIINISEDTQTQPVIINCTYDIERPFTPFRVT